MRQAVLIIHGIGEQRPLGTLRGIVKSLVGKEFRSKPDNINSSYELRLLTHQDTEKNIKTDFYEYYWAYRFRDSKYFHLKDWVKELMFSSYIPKRLIKIKRVLIALIILFIIGPLYLISKLIFNYNDYNILDYSLLIFLVLTTSAVFYLGRIIINYAGDAARYFNSSPDNIAERQLIKKDGIEILRTLHEMKNRKQEYKYDRIIIAGHSLGSVIGYDIIKHSWIEYNKKVKFKIRSVNDENDNLLQSLEKSGNYLCKIKEEQVNETEVLSSINNFQKLQNEVLIDQNNKERNWIVSDFVTMGSPLTYADFLMAKNKKELSERIDQREIPICPPTDGDFRNEDMTKRRYTYEKNGFENLHHAAPFALTRWTNIFYKGDIIGGKLSDLFGPGVKDIKAEITNGKNIHSKLISHIYYWDHKEQNDCVKKLSDIIFNRVDV